jgi:hypothetical protein
VTNKAYSRRIAKGPYVMSANGTKLTSPLIAEMSARDPKPTFSGMSGVPLVQAPHGPTARVS